MVDARLPRLVFLICVWGWLVAGIGCSYPEDQKPNLAPPLAKARQAPAEMEPVSDSNQPNFAGTEPTSQQSRKNVKWQKLNVADGGSTRQLYLNPHKPQELFLFDNNGKYTSRGIFKSTDGAESWHFYDYPSYFVSFAVHPTL